MGGCHPGFRCAHPGLFGFNPFGIVNAPSSCFSTHTLCLKAPHNRAYAIRPYRSLFCFSRSTHKLRLKVPPERAYGYTPLRTYFVFPKRNARFGEGEKMRPLYIGVKMGLMKNFSSIFACSGFVSIGRKRRKNFCKNYHFFVSQKRL